MDGFRARLHAAEGMYAREADAAATRKHLEKLMQAGKVPSEHARMASPEAPTTQLSLSNEHVPTVLRQRHHAEKVYNHTPSLFPASRMAEIDGWAHLGSRVSFGRARWSMDGSNIFSVAEGKRLAQEPVKVPTVFERNRMARVAQAALESPTIQGIRLLPQFTPGRALLWGTILAVWGTGAVVMTSARSLDIHTVDEAGDKLRSVLAPYGDAINAAMAPVKDWTSVEQLPESAKQSVMPELARQLRAKLAGP